ncbi:MAG: hypothetical protein ABSE92_02765 [Terriglobales bacterium]
MDLTTIWHFVQTGLGIVGGIGFILVAVSRWFGSFWLGRAMEADRARYAKQLEELRSSYARELEFYKTQLERSVLITRAQFQTEFRAMKQVFQKLSQVRLRMASLRPSIDVTGGGANAEERKLKRFERLQEDFNGFLSAYNELVAVVEDFSPFYPIEVYRQLNECLAAAMAEQFDIKLEGLDALSHAGFNQGKLNMDRFLAAYNKVSELIRDRISHLAIVPTIT